MCFPTIEAEQVVGGSYGPIDLGIQCETSRTITHPIPSGKISKATHAKNHFTFSFEMVKSAMSQVLVYDLSGRIVAKLHRGQLRSGFHQYQLRAANHGMLPGFYVFTVRAGNSVTSKKFVVN